MRDLFPTYRLLLPWPFRTTSAQRRSLMRLLAVGVEEGLPLGPMVRTWASDESGRQRRRLVRLADLLDDGVPLANAVEVTPGVLADDEVLAIRFDSQSGTRASAVRERISAMEPPREAGIHRPRSILMYVVLVIAVLILITTFNQIWITPQTINILEDYHIKPPYVLVWWIEVSKQFIRNWFLLALFACALVAFCFSAWPGRLIRRTFLGRLLSPVRDTGTADVLQKLALTMRAGRPLAGAMSTLARYHYDPALRHKLLYVRNEMEQGVEVWPSMAAAGLLNRPEERLMESAERLGNRSWVLDQLANVKLRRTAGRRERLLQLLLPMLVIAMGGLVLVQALALLVPLREILNALL